MTRTLAEVLKDCRTKWIETLGKHGMTAEQAIEQERAMNTNDEQYGKIINVSPADERGRVTVTHEDGTKVTVIADQLPKAEQREPLLSDDELLKERPLVTTVELSTGKLFGTATAPMNCFEVRDFYENLITSGELIARKTCTYGKDFGLKRNCSNCQHLSSPSASMYFNFCPGCGARIVP